MMPGNAVLPYPSVSVLSLSLYLLIILYLIISSQTFSNPLAILTLSDDLASYLPLKIEIIRREQP